MTDYPTLIEKLERSHGGVPCVATAEIRRLIADNEALRKANLDCVDHYNDCRAEAEALRTQVAELGKDAERYRWWTKTENDIPSRVFSEGKPSVDAFIDAAIDAQKGNV